jgi:hypothetical protein
MTTDNKPDRKPDFETESLRMWRTKKGSKEFSEAKASEGFELDIGNGKLKFCGFTEGRDKDNKLVFAYKFKHEEKNVLFYFPKEYKDNEGIKQVMDFLEKIAVSMGYELTNVEDMLKSIKMEVDLMGDEKND